MVLSLAVRRTGRDPLPWARIRLRPFLTTGQFALGSARLSVRGVGPHFRAEANLDVYP